MNASLKYNLGDKVVACCDNKLADLCKYNGEVGVVVQIDLFDKAFPYAVVFLPIKDEDLSRDNDAEFGMSSLLIEGKRWPTWVNDFCGVENMFDHWCWAPEMYLEPAEIEAEFTGELDLGILFEDGDKT